MNKWEVAWVLGKSGFRAECLAGNKIVLQKVTEGTASFNDFWVENEMSDGIQAQSSIEQAFLIPKM